MLFAVRPVHPRWATAFLRAIVLPTACLFGALEAPAADLSLTGEQPTVILVVGAAGEPEYGKMFSDWAGLWEKACQQAGAKSVLLGQETSATNVLSQLQQALQSKLQETNAALWLVFLGHGTFDGQEARFNLRGPDLSASELVKWLEPFRRPLAVINASSASGPFISKLSGKGRVVVTATKSGFEQNFARFGQYLAESIADPQADLDKDDQTSLLEAYLTASRRVAEFYQLEGRLATEHALLDDNGDGLGTPADWFRGIRAVKKAREGAELDGFRAHQLHLVLSEAEKKLPPEVRARRDELEIEIARLRESKTQLGEDEYYRRLEKLLLELARLYESGS